MDPITIATITGVCVVAGVLALAAAASLVAIWGVCCAAKTVSQYSKEVDKVREQAQEQGLGQNISWVQKLGCVPRSVGVGVAKGSWATVKAIPKVFEGVCGGL